MPGFHLHPPELYGIPYRSLCIPLNVTADGLRLVLDETHGAETAPLFRFEVD